MRGLRFLRHATVLLGFLVPGPAISHAETSPGAADATSGPSSEKADTAPSAVTVTGFRSAHFGMDEAEVRGAIAKDFGKDVKIKPTTNAAERTHGLTVQVPDVLPGGGAADVAYVFGYKAKKLIQVSLVWSKATDPAITADKLVADADVLRSTFAEQGYKAETVVSDVATRTGVLVFRGSDADGHTTALILEGRTVADKDKKSFTPMSLLLLYIADPKHADVFRLAPGQF